VDGLAPTAKPAGKVLAPATATERAAAEREREAQWKLAEEKRRAQKVWANHENKKAGRPAGKSAGFDPYRITVTTDEPAKPKPPKWSPYDLPDKPAPRRTLGIYEVEEAEKNDTHN
jgi:hypothetical protein